MAATPSRRLQSMLQAAVQSVQWTYSLFWQFSPQQGILVWGEGHYNGAIKTRKTVNSMEISDDEASIQRSQQLRELYISLSAGETEPPSRRPCAALSPEDLTESEWFYLMCVSFTFPPGVGFPGKAYARRQHVWLTGANEVDSKTFSRAILAKSARIQTVVCVPLVDGVVELGTTDKVQEDIGIIQHIKTFFTDNQSPLPPKPALSEYSTSNSATSADNHRRLLPSPPGPIIYAVADQEDVEEEEETENSDSEEKVPAGDTAEPNELMQMQMSEDIRLGSPDDGSNNLDLDMDSDFHLLKQPRIESYRAESTRLWPLMQQPPSNSGGAIPLEELTQDETHYSQTVSTILQCHPNRWSGASTAASHVSPSIQSSFTQWTSRIDPHSIHVPIDSTSQWLLKYILLSVPFLHIKHQDENSQSPKSRDADPTTRLKKVTSQDELCANHVLAERRRREKLNEKFIILRSLVPFVTKMDKASILGDVIEYVKQLCKKIQYLEERESEIEKRLRLSELQRRTSTGSKDPINCRPMGPSSSNPDKKKLRVVEGNGGCAKPIAKTMGSTTSVPALPTPTSAVTIVQVSIIESDALLELQCQYKEGLLLDVMQMFRGLRIETTAVQSSLSNGVFVAELRAKVKENVHGKKTSIVEVKRAIQQIIPHNDNF